MTQTTYTTTRRTVVTRAPTKAAKQAPAPAPRRQAKALRPATPPDVPSTLDARPDFVDAGLLLTGRPDGLARLELNAPWGFVLMVAERYRDFMAARW